MPYEFTKGTNRYAIKTSTDKFSPDEIAIKFKSENEVKRFFSPSIEKLMPPKSVLSLAKNSAPSYCCRSKDKNGLALSDQDYLELFYLRVAKEELKVVQKSELIKYSADPIGWFDWDEFFADPRVQPNFHELPASVQLATIKAWQKEKAPLTIVDIYKPTEFKSNRSPKGTVGVGFSAAAGTGKAASGTFLVVFDEVGNVGYLRGKVETNGCQTKKLSVKEANVVFRKGRVLFVIFSLSVVLSCAWNVSHKDQHTITGIGLTNVMEIDMSIDEFAKKGIPYTTTAPPYQKPNTSFFRADQLGIEFELLNRQIVRIWFFAEKNSTFKLFMPKENQTKYLSSISANDIILNFGRVNKYENQYPPKGRREPVWAKYRAFGIATNTIEYPGNPFHFGLNWDDTLSYVAVSKIN